MLDKNVELLAPVGSMESLFAAVQNGADAVYLGGKLFNARQYASNFDKDELKYAIEYAHLRGVKVYVTVNILIDDDEMKDTLDYIKYLYEIDVDGIIVQDLGLAYLIKKLFPDLPLHGSTQMTINNLPGALFLQKLGFERVVLAREVPLEEIKYIHQNSNIELEGFIHGALCVCYSGQCLMSSIIGGRSGNRGTCAQPCRMAYSLIDYSSGEELSDLWNIKYVLSPKDLNTIEVLDSIVDSGIASLKIEGRMKRPEYVAVIVKNYRKALDLGIDSITEEDKKDIYEIFNRGFTKGLPFKDFGRKFISYDRPDNRAVPSDQLLNRAKDSFSKENIKFPIEMEMEILIDKPAKLCLKYEGESIEIKSDLKVEKGKKVVLTKERVLAQLAKLNDTVYYLERAIIHLDEGAFLPISVINSLRREAIKRLNNKRMNFNKRKPLPEEEYLANISKYFTFTKVKRNIESKISLSLLKESQFNQIDIRKLDRIYVGFDGGLKEALFKIKEAGKEAFLLTDRILYKGDLDRLKEKIKSVEGLIDGIAVSNLGTLNWVKYNFNFDIHGDIGLNIFNSFSANFLKEFGLKSLTLSPEVNMKQIEKLCTRHPFDYEAIGYGYLPLMIMKHCPMSLLKGCKDDSNCRACSYSKGYGLKDRMGLKFYMERKGKITTIYNSVPIMVLDSLRQIYKKGVNMIRLDFTFEEEGIRDIQEIYYACAKGLASEEEVMDYVDKFRKRRGITKGHYFRGVI
ncbi:DUF3656 domain-containing U32 family peptidase [Tepidimicrobium xylanilyticum]|uniref:Putative protease n=1 Tax=Tepidimicrobium xylanilyticum TaxID=1123352 RepID=A0A1H3BGW7_9FIRM|nr:U32 family peptidase [Tepidimicrobium xylanilyticum]SDX41183.1 putative protease [Tepidimicrobium xylanilyticum]